MSMLGDWFIADPTDAMAIAAVIENEVGEFEHWPHLEFQDVSEIALMSLWGILRGKPRTRESTSDRLLHPAEPNEETTLFVFTLKPEFITVLTTLTDDTLKATAKKWQKNEEMSEWDMSDVEAVLRQMVVFAQKSVELGKPVLQLSVI
jgi:hypothetical protein